ncbi:unnamed protein product [Strongylus vulgaris]|uniref:Uncharacterized protein n=1 Tax=Strongylus vulgaris TaxID=40348 RepID=A0A3P7JKG3_STRVU|nr:unnamed protein product [Strongylus vulgaris]
MEPFTTYDECAITHLPHVRLARFHFLQNDYVLFDAPCSFKKGMKIGVDGKCLGVVGVEHETFSMASR